MSIERTAYPISLPSKGLPYKGKLNEKKGVLEIYPMRAKEQKLIAGFAGGKKTEALNQLLKACFKDDIDPKELTTSDRLYILMWLRIISLGEVYKIELSCPNCSLRFDHDINLNEFEIKYIDDDFVEPFELTLPIAGDTIGLRLFRGEDESALQKYSESYKKGDLGDSTFIFRLTRQLMSVEGEELTDSQKKDYIENLIMKDFNAIEEALVKNDSGMIPSVKADCPKCDYRIETTLPLGPTFFRG